MLEYVVLTIIVILIFMLSSKLEMFDNSIIVTNILPFPDKLCFSSAIRLNPLN